MFLSVVAIRLSEHSTRAFSFALTYSVWSHRPASPRLSLSLSVSFPLVECLDFSTNPRINPPSSSGKLPGTRTLETSTISFPLTYTADPFTGVHAFAKELNQNNKQTRKSDYRGGPCLDVAWREIVRAIIRSLFFFLSLPFLSTIFIVAIFGIKSQIRKNNVYMRREKRPCKFTRMKEFEASRSNLEDRASGNKTGLKVYMYIYITHIYVAVIAAIPVSIRGRSAC